MRRAQLILEVNLLNDAPYSTEEQLRNYIGLMLTGRLPAEARPVVKSVGQVFVIEPDDQLVTG